MSLIDLIKNACGGSDDKEYDVFGQPTTFVNPFAKDKIVANHEAGKSQDEVQVDVDKQEGYAIDAEFADKAARLMDEHTQAVIGMIKGSWKTEREELLKQVEDAKKAVEDIKAQMQSNEANRRQAQSRANDMSARISEVEAEREKFEIENKSLQSRLKAMEAKGGVDNLNAELDRVKKELEEQTAEVECLTAAAKEAAEGPSVEELNKQIQQRDEVIEQLRVNNSEIQERLAEYEEELKGAEELQAALVEVEQFKEKKNAEIAALRQQVAEYKSRDTEFDQMRKDCIVLRDDNEKLNREIEELKATAEVQYRRSVEAGNTIDGLKSQLAQAKASADDINNKFNALNADGNEKQANFAKIVAERDDARAELKRAKVLQDRLQHEANAMKDAIVEKDRQIAALRQMAASKMSAAMPASAPLDNDIPFDSGEDAFVDDADDTARPPHPGDDSQLTLF